MLLTSRPLQLDFSQPVGLLVSYDVHKNDTFHLDFPCSPIEFLQGKIAYLIKQKYENGIGKTN